MLILISRITIKNFLYFSAGIVLFTTISACNNGGTASSNSSSYYASLCHSVGGYYQYGTVNSQPNSDYTAVTNYKAATESLEGIPLSHTHIEITSAIDGKIYDVAIDNVFANGYNPFSYVVPSAYTDNLTAGSKVYLCSGNPSQVPYPVNEADSNPFATQGFDWVHTNCAASGYPSSFYNGFLYDQNNNNLTNSQTYCYLWP